MIIVLITDWFSEKMGYSENCLAEALGAEGHEVHLITSTANVYCDSPDYNEIYEPFLGPAYVSPGIKDMGNYTLHRLQIRIRWRRIHIFKHFFKTIRRLNPDVIQSYEANSSWALQLALMKPFMKYRLFTAIHTVASVYPAYSNYNKFNLVQKIRLRLFDTLLGYFISKSTTLCYGATIDASEIGERFFGISKEKIKTDPLGVETNKFKPIGSSKKHQNSVFEMKKKFNFSNDDVICIYTGRFTEDKNPLILAKAIKELRSKGRNFKALFLGSGIQKKEIEECEGCQIHPFVKYYELPDYYRMANIGVWPKQESTSMIDAAASGIPIVVSNKVYATERVNGNGLTFKENDLISLTKTLDKLYDKKIRSDLGKIGRQKMKEKYSWKSIAKNRVSDYLNLK